MGTYWVDRVAKTHEIHIERKRRDPKWTITDTATMLSRSVGSICEDLMLFDWLKSHETELSRCHTIQEALAFVRKKKKQLELET